MSRKDGLFDRTARSLMEVRKASYLKNPISSEMGVGQDNPELLQAQGKNTDTPSFSDCLDL